MLVFALLMLPALCITYIIYFHTHCCIHRTAVYYSKSNDKSNRATK